MNIYFHVLPAIVKSTSISLTGGEGDVMEEEGWGTRRDFGLGMCEWGGEGPCLGNERTEMDRDIDERQINAVSNLLRTCVIPHTSGWPQGPILVAERSPWIGNRTYRLLVPLLW